MRTLLYIVIELIDERKNSWSRAVVKIFLEELSKE